MAISRFDTPADYKPIDTYTPLPYQEIALGLQQKQHQFDEQTQKGQLAQKLAESFQDLNKVAIGYDDKTNKLIEVPTTYAGTNAAFKAGVQEKLNYFADKDIAGDPTVRKEYNNFLNEVKNYASTTGNRLTEAKKKYDKIASNYAQNKALGKDLAGGTGENWFANSGNLFKGDFSSLDKEYSPLEHVDVYKNISNFLSPLKANSSDVTNYVNDFTKVKQGVESLDYYFDKKSKGYQLDPKGKVFNTLKTYLYTPNNEFDNVVARNYDNLVRTGQFGDKPPTIDAYKNAKRVEYFDRALNANAYLKTDSSIDIDSGLLARADEQNLPDDVVDETFYTESVNQPNSVSPLDGLEFDEQGHPKESNKTTVDTDTEGRISTSPFGSTSLNFKNVGNASKYKEQTEKLVEVAKNIKEVIDHNEDLKKDPKFKNMTLEKITNIYNNAYKKASQLALPYKAINESATDFYTNQLFKGTINEKGISVLMSGDEGDMKNIGFSKIAEKLKLSKDELTGQLQKTSRVNGIVNGEKPGMFITSVLDGRGNRVSIAMTGSKEQERNYTRSWFANEGIRNKKIGINKFQDPVDGKYYIAQTYIDPETEEFKVTIIDAIRKEEIGANGVKTVKIINAPNPNSYDVNTLFQDDDTRWKNGPVYRKFKEKTIKNKVVNRSSY